MRIYFIQNEGIWSCSLKNAAGLAMLALAGQEYNLDDWGKRIKHHRIFIHEYHCLDFDKEDWSNLFNTIKTLMLRNQK